MSVLDVQQALIQAGTIARQNLAEISFDPTNVSTGQGVATSQAIWFGQSGFFRDQGVVFQDNGDTTGNTLNFGFKTAGGTTFTTATIVAWDSNSAILFDTGAYYIVSTIGLSSSDASLYPISDFGTTASYTPPVCFVEGTLIRTDRGEVAVEHLQEGDWVRVLDGAGETSRPVMWIGQREVNLAAHPNAEDAQPIRIRRDAFGAGMPCRDLLVSPDHALLAGDVLVPARLLLNGASIVRETRLTKVRYFHVELDQHSILFSENLPTESYLDTGNRSFFQNGGSVIDLNVGFVGKEPNVARETHCCRPFVSAAEQVLPIWQDLVQRAASNGQVALPVETTQDPSLQLSVNGRLVQPMQTADDLVQFVLPADATEVHVLSQAARPSDTQPWIDDPRRLGVAINRIRVRDGRGVEDLALDGPAPGRGWWDVERAGVQLHRWTNGDAELRLPEAHTAGRVLELQIAGTMAYPVETAGDAAELAPLALTA